MEQTAAPPRHKWATYGMACALIILALCELARIYLGLSTFIIFARLAFLALCPCLLPFFALREWALTILASLLAIGLVLKEDTQSLLYALDRAAFFAAFIVLVTLLKDAAQRSGAVLALGQYMTNQPPGRRFYTLATGGHAMGVLLNFGAISLLTPLIQRGVKAASKTPSEAKLSEQRQISALLRGFSWMILWSPTALTQAVLFTSFEGVRAAVIIPLGIAASIIMILLGRAMDLYQWRHIPPGSNSTPPLFPKEAGLTFLFICTALISATYLVLILANVSAAIALMLVAPIAMILWIYSQNTVQNPQTPIRSTGADLHEIFILSAKDPARSAFILGAAGFIGEAGAKLAPVAEVAQALSINAMPVWLFLMALPVIITLCGQIALSPILVVVFLSAVINELPSLPADPNLIVFALGAGWALSMSASPNASATLLISAISGIKPTTLTWRWNGGYAFACFLIFSVAFLGLSFLFE